jgi:protein OS-9
VIFSDSFISEEEASSILEGASDEAQEITNSAESKSIESSSSSAHTPAQDHVPNPAHETYELLYLKDEAYLCTIPIVEIPVKNETSEAEARVAEQKELARATDRGWELLQELDGQCLYFVSGWWSYAFCYNSEITQFHQLQQAGAPMHPPQKDPSAKEFILGKVKAKKSKQDEWGNQIDVRKGKEVHEPPKTELQVKGDTKYLVQKMEGGTTCDLTGKPRRIEVQFHCNPHVTDRIGYIKEVTTCSYLMVVYTPRLCNDIAFMPQKEEKAHPITCRGIVPEDEKSYHAELKTLEAELESRAEREKPVYVGGLVLGGGKWANKDGQRMPVPANFGKESTTGRTVEVIARAKGKSEGGQVEIFSDAELRKLDLDPETIEKLKKEIQKMAKDKGWKIEVVNEPGQIREILGVVEGDKDEDEEREEGSQETLYKDEL